MIDVVLGGRDVTGGAGSGPRRGEHGLSPACVEAVVGAPRPPRQVPPERFASTEHLSAEAVVAYVDAVLPVTAVARAEQHLRLCAQCRDEVDQQRAARQVLRGSGPIRMPDGLRSRLAELPERGRPPVDTAGPAVGPVAGRSRGEGTFRRWWAALTGRGRRGDHGTGRPDPDWG